LPCTSVESGWRAGLGYGGFLVGEGAFAIFDVHAGASVACANPSGRRTIGPAQFGSPDGDCWLERLPFLALTDCDLSLPVVNADRSERCLPTDFDFQQTSRHRSAIPTRSIIAIRLDLPEGTGGNALPARICVARKARRCHQNLSH